PSAASVAGPWLGNSERVDVRLQAIRVELNLLLHDVLASLDGCLDPSLDVGRRDHDETARPGVEELSQILEVGPAHARGDVSGRCPDRGSCRTANRETGADRDGGEQRDE